MIRTIEKMNIYIYIYIYIYILMFAREKREILECLYAV